MKIEHLQGLISAPFTPFDNNGKLDVSLIPEYYAFLKRNGITGAFINGSTGEGVSITLEEKKAVASGALAPFFWRISFPDPNNCGRSQQRPIGFPYSWDAGE